MNTQSIIFSDNPLVTVVISTFNRSVLVREAVASVLAQTYSNWELIVADDGSRDDTVKLIRSLSDPRISVLELPHCGNIATVRNAGARSGSGVWIAFLDSDDIWVPEKLEIQLGLLRRESKHWSYGGFELMNDQGQTVPGKAGSYSPHSGWIVRELLTCEAAVNIGTLLIDRMLFDELGGFDTAPLLNFREDYDLALRLAMKAEGAASPGLLMKVREHQGRATSSFDDGNARTGYAYLHFIRADPGKELVRIARRQLAYHLAEAAVKDMKAGRRRRAIGQLLSAVKTGGRWKYLLSAFRRVLLAIGSNTRGTNIH